MKTKLVAALTTALLATLGAGALTAHADPLCVFGGPLDIMGNQVVPPFSVCVPAA